MEIRVFTAFSGYDSQCLALERLKQNFPDFDYELVGWSEIDKYAIQAHNALFPQWADRNYGDISKIDWNEVPDFDLFTYSSPCQDFSNAGLQRGGEEGSGTRSSLLWECRRSFCHCSISGKRSWRVMDIATLPKCLTQRTMAYRRIESECSSCRYSATHLTTSRRRCHSTSD